jgi:hypothetical protein
MIRQLLFFLSYVVLPLNGRDDSGVSGTYNILFREAQLLLSAAKDDRMPFGLPSVFLISVWQVTSVFGEGAILSEAHPVGS